MSDIGLRPATAQDDDFLRGVYADSRADEVAAFGWPPDQVSAFLVLQSRARTADRAANHPDAARFVIVADGEDVGSVTVDRTPRELLVLDLAVLAPFRGRGIATAVLGDLTAEASRDGVPTCLHTIARSPAIPLYERCGFSAQDGDGVYVRMVRPLEAGAR